MLIWVADWQGNNKSIYASPSKERALELLLEAMGDTYSKLLEDKTIQELVTDSGESILLRQVTL